MYCRISLLADSLKYKLGLIVFQSVSNYRFSDEMLPREVRHTQLITSPFKYKQLKKLHLTFRLFNSVSYSLNMLEIQKCCLYRKVDRDLEKKEIGEK